MIVDRADEAFWNSDPDEYLREIAQPDDRLASGSETVIVHVPAADQSIKGRKQSGFGEMPLVHFQMGTRQIKLSTCLIDHSWGDGFVFQERVLPTEIKLSEFELIFCLPYTDLKGGWI